MYLDTNSEKVSVSYLVTIFKVSLPSLVLLYDLDLVTLAAAVYYSKHTTAEAAARASLTYVKGHHQALL